MGKERCTVIISTDKDGRGVRNNLKEGIEREGNFNVIGFSYTDISRIRPDIVNVNPNIVFTAVSLMHPEEMKELRGYIRKIKTKLPGLKVVVLGPVISDALKATIGADFWIDETNANEFLGRKLSGIIGRE